MVSLAAMRADLLISNASVFTLDGTRATTVVVTDGRITAVGVERADVTADEEIDAEGGLVAPGFNDAHVHPVHGGEILSSCDLNPAEAIEGYRAIIASHAHSGEGWITGGGWAFEAFPRGIPTTQQLDDITGDRPTYLSVKDGHAAWVNSAALRAAGIDELTPDPPDGRIERFEDGRPNGCLQEGAMDLVARHVPPRTRQQLRGDLLAGQTHLVALGITGWQDAIVTEEIQQAYLDADAAGDLLGKVRGALWWEREQGIEQVTSLIERRRMRSARFDPSSVKMMLDGVCENFTAALLGSYLDADGHQTGNTGLDFIDPAELPAIVSGLHAVDFQVHFHALGDRAVRNALDALEAAEAAHGHKDLRHHLAHIQVVDPADIPRFRALGAIANAQPLWAMHEEAMDLLTIPFLGEPRASHQYPFGALHRAGAEFAMGSDWSVSSPDPLLGLEVAVHRMLPGTPAERRHRAGYGDGGRPFLPEEALDLRTAFVAYTQGSAFVSHLEERTGTLAAGKDADMVILDGDPFSTGHPARHEVTHTIIDGNVVYRKAP